MLDTQSCWNVGAAAGTKKFEEEKKARTFDLHR